MGFLDYGLAAKAFADGFRQTYITDAEREKQRAEMQEAAMQNKIRQAQLEEYQRKAQLNAKYREQLGLMSAPQLGNEQAPVQQTVTGNFSNGLSPLGDPTLLNTPTREVLPSKLDAISTNNPYAKMMVGMLPYVDADTGINSLIKLEEMSKKGGITLNDLVKAATEGKLGPQGQALLERAGYGGVFQQKPQDKKYDTEERYDSKSHITYGRDFYWNDDGTKTYIGNERPIKGRESTNIHIGGKDSSGSTYKDLLNQKKEAEKNRVNLLKEYNDISLNPEAKKLIQQQLTDNANEIAYLNAKLNINQSTPKPTDVMPDASKHKGRVIRDTVTGDRFKSNGKQWVKM